MKSTKVLVVNEDPDLLESSLVTLRDAGFSVNGAANVAECLESLGAELPDLILLDINLPHLSGLQFRQRIKANPITSSVAVAHFTSDNISSEDHAADPASGANSCVARPICGRELVARVEATLKEKRAEEEFQRLTGELRTATQALRQIMENSLDVICTINAQGEFVEVSVAAEKTWGFSREELIGRRYIDLVHIDDRAMTEATAAAIKAGQPVRHFENRYCCKDASVVLMMWSSFWSQTEEKFFCVARDITACRRLESQSLRAQRMEGLGTLAGGIAHDLNNVLSPIVMSIGLLKLKHKDASTLDVLETIEMNAHRGSDMVRQVLSFARGVEGERFLVQPKYLFKDVRKIVGDTFPKNVELKITTPPDLWNVLGDATQLYQVLLNLCVNARDAMAGGGRITITAENLVVDKNYAAMNTEAKPGPYVVLQVQDNGTGMPPEILEKVFDPFFTTKEFGKGTGLGLSTAFAIVKSHAGFIRVTSEVDRGSSFKVYLPAQSEPGADADEVVPSSPSLGRGELILVVDDEHSIRTIAQQTLESFGYRCLLAADGAEAVALYAKHQTEVAAVITDMMMPVMEGPVTIQILRKLNSQLPIIGTSGLTDNSYADRAANLGVKHFLPKPYTAEALLNMLREVLPEET